MATLKRILKFFFINQIDSIKRHKKTRKEIKKFQAPIRKNIYSKITLTKDQREAIDKLFTVNYGRTVPHIWHQHYTAFTGSFDVNYFPELLYIPAFEHFMNMNEEYTRVLSDKNISEWIANKASVLTIKTKISCVAGMYRDENYKAITRDMFIDKLSNMGEVFIKPSVDTSSGRGCAILNMQDGIDLITKKTAEIIADEMGNNFLVQERMHCHESIAKIYPNSVNTFRIISYRWKDEICLMPAIMRIGCGGKYLDNAHAGGMFIAVNDDGSLHDTAYTEFNTQFKEHPDTHVVFDGHQIVGFAKVLEAAKRAHALIPQVGVINWDFSINEDGNPFFVEANMRAGSIWLIQMAHGKSGFGDKTPEVLKWIKLMEETPKTGRNRYAFGKTC